jgi:hypothetical protein
MRVTFTVTNNNPDTVWTKLAAKLGREPTADEAKAEVQRIIAEARDAAPKGRIQK